MVESYASTKVELFFCGRNLLDKDTFSKSDPFLVALVASNNSNKFHEIGRTEVIRDNLNPNWKSTIIADYYFEYKQPIVFKVLDYDESAPDHLGEVQTTLGELVSKGTTLLKLSQRGNIVVRVEEVKTLNDEYTFFIKGIKLDKKDTFGKSDPYLIFYRDVAGTWAEVHRTEIIKNTLDPIWKPFTIRAQKLCNGDVDKLIKIECFDWNRFGSHDLIGIAEVTLAQLSQKGFSFPIFENQKKKSQNKPAGTLEVYDMAFKRVLSFIDYLRAGVQISFSIAIDFTASNGEYSQPSSLHFVNPNMPNQYEKAIWEVGNILEAYDTDKLFPVFGFGGVPVGENKVNHCFSLTFNPENPYVQGTAGVLEAYRAGLRRISLSGPTLFHHIIDATISVTERTGPTAQYNILLIITDGAIMDMPDTISSIVRGSRLPLSIIIIGVGTADFTSMEALDCDDGKLRNGRGEYALRDIVQFVPFHKFSGNSVALAAEVLREVPSQVTEYMSFIGYAPQIPEFQSFPPVSDMGDEGHRHKHKHKHHEKEEVILPPLDLPSLPEGKTEPEIIAEGNFNAFEYVNPSVPEYKENIEYADPSVPEYKENE